MMRIALCFCLCLATLQAYPADTEKSSLSSTNANYDGNSLILTGHVALDHGLGKMTAEEALLQRQEADKDFPFSLIQLRKDVLLSLKSSAQIACASADLDFASLKGTLQGPEGGCVVYSDQVRKKRGESVPLTLTGKHVELLFSKSAQDEKKADYDIDHILLKEEVGINYAEGIELQAHHAVYRKESSVPNKTSKREFQGIITAYPKNEQSPCKLSYAGDDVFAEMVDIDLINAKMSLLHPKGILAATLSSHLEQGQLHFQSDYLYWDQEKNTLTLKGNITIEEASLGVLHAQEELLLTQSVVKGKRLLKKIDSKGDSSLVYKDAYGHSHTLISHGGMHLDRDALKAIIDSPVKEGSVSLENQLYYEESEIAFYADHASLEYSMNAEEIQPSSLTLKGNIRLFSHDPSKPPRFGSADRVTYSLTTRTLILSANPGKKVLFWDETQGMHLSAPEVHIVYDPETKQQTVKGVGAVQFSFTPEEHTKLQQLFPQLKVGP